MRAHLENAWYGVLDYAAYPATLLAVAPVLIRNLGLSGYGIFTFAMAVTNTGGVIASGFGDANIQKIAGARAVGDMPLICDTVRSVLGVHLVLGTAIAMLGVALAPWASTRLTSAQPWNHNACTRVLIISSLLVLLRALETVAVSTQRAFQSYANALAISAIIRILTGISAAILSSWHSSIQTIFWMAIVLLTIGTALQLFRLGQKLSFVCLLPTFRGRQVRALLTFGGFTWIQTLGSIVFSQLDRLLVGLWLGSVIVTAYSLAAQLAQPIAGATAAALHFVFPQLAHRAAQSGVRAIARPVRRAFAWNTGIVLVQASGLLLFGRPLLESWVGKHNSALSEPLLPALVLASSLAALSVTGAYALLALGRARASSCIILAASGLMLIVAKPLISRWGAEGMAIARVASGAAMLLVYVPLWRHIRGAQHLPSSAAPLPSMASQGALD